MKRAAGYTSSDTVKDTGPGTPLGDQVRETGDLTGPLFGHVPNLYTLRGHKIRYVQWYLDGVQRVIDLEPEQATELIVSHLIP